MLILLISIPVILLAILVGEVYTTNSWIKGAKKVSIIILFAIVGLTVTHLIGYPIYMAAQPSEPPAAYEILESKEIEVVRVDNDGYYAVTNKGTFKKIFNNPNFTNSYIVTEEASPFDSKYPKVYKETYRPDYDWLTSLIPP